MSRIGIPFFIVGVVFLIIGTRQPPFLVIGASFVVVGLVLGRRGKVKRHNREEDSRE
jgi:drug/metabolite transporter (DMT)-like permease